MGRLIGLDGLRGILAVYVMVSHMAPFAAMPAWLARALSHGGAAVDVFFILSGLAIVQSLEKFQGAARPFLLARAGRIFPAYLVVFLCAVAVQPLPTGLPWMPWVEADNLGRAMWSETWPTQWAERILVHLLMLHGVFPDAVLPHVWVAFLGSAWSLSTEWQFYVVALLFVRAGMSVRWMVAAFIGIAIGGALWDALAADPWRFSRAFLPNKAHYFALGIASWGLVRALASPRSAMPGVAGEASPARGAIIFYTVILVAVSALAFSKGEIGKLLPPLVWTMCLAADLRPGATLLTPLGWVLRSRPLQWLGAISYSLYLVNEPLQKLAGLLVAWIAQGDSWYFTALWIPMALLPPIGIAALLRRWVELPALRWTGARVQRLQSTGGGGPEVTRAEAGAGGLCIRSRAGYTRPQ